MGSYTGLLLVSKYLGVSYSNVILWNAYLWWSHVYYFF